MSNGVRQFINPFPRVPGSLNPLTGMSPFVVHHQMPAIGMPAFGPAFCMPAFGMITPQIESVGCIIITKSSKHGGYDFIMPHSRGRRAFELFGGSIQYGTDPRDCMNSLLSHVGFYVKSHTPFKDVTDPMNGKLTRIYILKVNSMSCRETTRRLQANPVISSEFSHFLRFPVANILRNPNSICDDNGHVQNFTTFSQSTAHDIARNYTSYV
jgi:hypothetical protein